MNVEKINRRYTQIHADEFPKQNDEFVVEIATNSSLLYKRD